MKAWYVTDLPNCVYAGVVFAETRGKARHLCVLRDDIIGEVAFTDVLCRRFKEADKLYRGSDTLDWNNDEDRLLMVSELGMHCNEDTYDPDECERCCAREICEMYAEKHEGTGDRAYER